ncbi:glycosyltransferase family 90 protein [Trichoderma cornu-damae]|uniref:Glycosyltransferase family 90 protein n=1 Tax=Trichoderma cornu-damae TaxID=654480 RepID=A0A9P8QIH7_9HYPO|nr:glycosyltransferase family 90 protein [Trichoderma cornu-damae]
MVKMLSPGFPMRRPSGLVRYGVLAAILLLALYTLSRSSSDISRQPQPRPLDQPAPNNPLPNPAADYNAPVPAGGANAPPPPPPPPSQGTAKPDSPGREPVHDASPAPLGPPPASGSHPIDKLVYDAQMAFAELASKESKTIEEAAQAYRQRRGRHPPPGFDRWYEFARSKNAVIVEDFFDRIYHDLQPFWGLDPAVIRKESWDFEMTINVRDGNATASSDFFWTKIWLKMIKTIDHLLPDMDIALNAMDEPRLFVPWEDVAGYMRNASKTVKMPKAKNVIREFQQLPRPGTGDGEIKTRSKSWEKTEPYWAIARRGCAPDSLSRARGLEKTADKTPSIKPTYAEPHMYKGFVSNFTLSTEICHQPDLQALEGIFIEPLSTSASKVLFPMFGGSKLGVNNEILLPAPMYWSEEERFTGGDDRGVAWADKANQVVWRGVATGGKNTANNWRGFQRHRFVAMNNGTTVSRVEKGEKPQNFALPDEGHSVQAQKDGKLGRWIDQWANVSFTDLNCSPPQNGRCNYTGHYFKPTKGVKMAEQFDFKYIPDIDGNSFSGRYLAFLRSTSLPIKATIWHEWHDSRLVAWKHFIPMDSRFLDYYGIMEYFLGYEGRNGHDRVAEKIATEGKEWAEQVLRKEDMQIYVLRLLYEYARLLDDKRESLGWVDDVLKDPSLEKTWKWW